MNSTHALQNLKQFLGETLNCATGGGTIATIKSIITVFWMQSIAGLIIFIGIQASGKTTFYQRFCAATHAHINLDTLNTRNKEMLAISECLASGKSFVVDNTNPAKTDRATYIPLAKGAGYEVMGARFERLMQAYLQTDPVYAGRFKHVWLRTEFPFKGTSFIDQVTGIDLVAPPPMLESKGG